MFFISSWKSKYNHKFGILFVLWHVNNMSMHDTLQNNYNVMQN